jgi:hypothetical protein
MYILATIVAPTAHEVLAADENVPSSVVYVFDLGKLSELSDLRVMVRDQVDRYLERNAPDMTDESRQRQVAMVLQEFDGYRLLIIDSIKADRNEGERTFVDDRSPRIVALPDEVVRKKKAGARQISISIRILAPLVVKDLQKKQFGIEVSVHGKLGPGETEAKLPGNRWTVTDSTGVVITAGQGYETVSLEPGRDVK